MEGDETCQTLEQKVPTEGISCEEKSETRNESLESKSADDILNELFTELGSKNFTDSVADFLKTPTKKKKKHKEKKESKKTKSKESKKQKIKETKSSKKKKKEQSSPKKRKKSDGDEQVGSDREDISEKQSRAEKKSSKTKEYTNNDREKDVEEGEIIEKHSASHHRTKSSHKETTTTSSKHSKSPAWISPAHDKEFGDEGRGRDRREDKKNYIEAHRFPTGGREYHKSRSRSPRGSTSRSRSRHEYPDHDKRRNFDRSPPGYRLDDESWHHASRNSRRRSPLHNRRQRDDDSRSDHFRSRRFIPEHDRRRIAPPYRRSRSRSHPRYGSDVIDKEKLLEIARRNATVLMKKGVLPTDIFSKDQIMALKAGGKSVEDLTAYCRKIAAKDAKRGDGDHSDDEGLDDGEAEHFIHHPFVVKERPMPQITLNIRNAIPLPVRTPQALAIENAVRKSQFPVSSGCQHRFKELEWKEVDEDQEKNKCKLVATIAPTPAPPAPVETPEPETEAKSSAVLPPPVLDSVPSVPSKDTGISLEPPELPQVDIGSVISARLKAMRALKENPECQEAKKELDSALVEMEQWAQAKALEPKFLSVSDLTSGPQAWAKRDQLKNAKQVASGMGMHLLQKMGWRPGEGLGKNKEGTTEPLALDVKTDKKGLMSQADLKVKGPQANVSMLYDLSGKHPVSALMELCTKRRWGPPVFDLCFEHGPPHQKSFVFKVTVNGVEYQPCIATNNKKLAKANAAAFCLQSLGLLKPAATSGAAETLQTVPSPAATSGGIGEAAGIRMLPSHLLQTVPSHP